MIKTMGSNSKEIALPPYTTCRLCRNSMTDVCVEDCAQAGDYRHFEIKSGVNLSEMPRFPMNEFVNQMPLKVRQIVVAIYLAKIVDHLQGVELSAAPRLVDPR